MNKHHCLSTILTTVLVLSGCDAGTAGASSQAGGAATAMPAQAERAVRTANAKGQSAPELDLDALLSPGDAARLAERPADRATRHRLQKPINSVHYSWSGNRKRQLPSGLRLPLDDELQVFQPAVRVLTSAETFRRQHLQVADPAQVERALQGLRQSQRYQAMTTEQRQMAEQMLSKSINRSPMQAVDGVGEVAAWDAPSDTLYVLVNQVVLAVRASTSDAPGENLALATKTARHVIGKL